MHPVGRLTANRHLLVVTLHALHVLSDPLFAAIVRRRIACVWYHEMVRRALWWAHHFQGWVVARPYVLKHHRLLLVEATQERLAMDPVFVLRTWNRGVIDLQRKLLVMLSSRLHQVLHVLLLVRNHHLDQLVFLLRRGHTLLAHLGDLSPLHDVLGKVDNLGERCVQFCLLLDPMLIRGGGRVSLVRVDR